MIKCERAMASFHSSRKYPSSRSWVFLEITGMNSAQLLICHCQGGTRASYRIVCPYVVVDAVTVPRARTLTDPEEFSFTLIAPVCPFNGVNRQPGNLVDVATIPLAGAIRDKRLFGSVPAKPGRICKLSP